ncbi:hypothetical protein Hanom_Chr09g00765621 [Helianthus anomalus]
MKEMRKPKMIIWRLLQLLVVRRSARRCKSPPYVIIQPEYQRHHYQPPLKRLYKNRNI